MKFNVEVVSCEGIHDALDGFLSRICPHRNLKFMASLNEPLRELNKQLFLSKSLCSCVKVDDIRNSVVT